MFRQQCQRSRSNYRYKEIEEGDSSNSLTTWAKCRVLNLLVRNAETNFGRQSLCHHYVPVSTRRMHCKSCQRRWKRGLFAKDNSSLETTKSNSTWAHRTPTFQACLGKPRVMCRRGTLTQFHQRVAIDRTRSYKDKQHMQRIEDFNHDAQPKQKHHFIANEFIKKINQKIYIYVESWSLPNNSVIHAMHFQNNQNNAVRCIIFGIYRENWTSNWASARK